MTMHSPSSESFAARGTAYSAARMGVDGFFFFHLVGSSHCSANPPGRVAAGASVAAGCVAGATGGGDVDVVCSAGARDHAAARSSGSSEKSDVFFSIGVDPTVGA
jgi:hypothetical protein